MAFAGRVDATVGSAPPGRAPNRSAATSAVPGRSTAAVCTQRRLAAKHDCKREQKRDSSWQAPARTAHDPIRIVPQAASFPSVSWPRRFLRQEIRKFRYGRTMPISGI